MYKSRESKRWPNSGPKTFKEIHDPPISEQTTISRQRRRPKDWQRQSDGLQNAQHELISSLWNSSGWLGDGVHGKYVYKSAILCAIWRLRRVTLDALALVVIGNDKAAKMCASVNRQWF